MKPIKTLACQGDILLRAVEAIPAGFKPVEKKGRIVLSHSETGHQHAIDDVGVIQYENPADPMICYLQISGEYTDVVHHRDYHTHGTIRLDGGGKLWEVRRQRENTPEGWSRPVVD